MDSPSAVSMNGQIFFLRPHQLWLQLHFNFGSKPLWKSIWNQRYSAIKAARTLGSRSPNVQRPDTWVPAHPDLWTSVAPVQKVPRRPWYLDDLCTHGVNIIQSLRKLPDSKFTMIYRYVWLCMNNDMYPSFTQVPPRPPTPRLSTRATRLPYCWRESLIDQLRLANQSSIR